MTTTQYGQHLILNYAAATPLGRPPVESLRQINAAVRAASTPTREVTPVAGADSRFVLTSSTVLREIPSAQAAIEDRYPDPHLPAQERIPRRLVGKYRPRVIELD